MKTGFYRSPVGFIRIGEENGRLVKLSFSGGSIFETPKKSDVIEYAKSWLEGYFTFRYASFDASLLDPAGTDFQKEIWRLLLEIPYGETVSYGGLARRYRERFSRPTSPRAVGGAVGKNPIALIIPCHRVVCSDGSPGGFAYGENVKAFLLAHEKQRKNTPASAQ